MDRDIEGGNSDRDQIDRYQQAHTLIRLIPNSIFPPRNARPEFHPSVPSIPRTSPERLALASPDSSDDASASTVLYLAYGANLSSAVLKRLDVKPISQINVSAPGLDLAFDLPGLPYWEPCFSNVAPRKIPKPPIPGDPPKPPFDPPGAGLHRKGDSSEEDGGYSGALLPALPPGIPSWNKGLYGVVYELTRDDFRKIIKTEGGGTAYKDILTPVLALPPPLNIPEKPPIPELPRPFLAHTLYAPRLPSFNPPGDGNGDSGSDSCRGDDGDDDPRDKKWWQKLLLPVRRPQPDYAQPSARYLNLIREGARQHYLPDDYQLYLARLQWYQITTWRQEIGRWLLLFLVLPLFAVVLALSSLLADKDGKVPRWLAIASTVLFNLVWIVYDKVFKPVFGDGERTIEEDDDGYSRYGDIRPGGIIYTHVREDEKSALLADW